ncbi:MAG: PTS sugar transporter subunit IIB, partial [Candidatus Delongbacteria bacterium]
MSLKRYSNHSLIRVDDRLIHGQVSVGWAPRVCADHMIIADDEIASSEEDSQLFLLGVPFDCAGRALSIKDAAAFIKKHSKERYIVVMRSIRAAYELMKAGSEFKELNIGGLHAEENKKEVLHYIFLDKEDIALIKKIERSGVHVYIQDLPSNTK